MTPRAAKTVISVTLPTDVTEIVDPKKSYPIRDLTFLHLNTSDNTGAASAHLGPIFPLPMPHPHSRLRCQLTAPPRENSELPVWAEKGLKPELVGGTGGAAVVMVKDG